MPDVHFFEYFVRLTVNKYLETFHPTSLSERNVIVDLTHNGVDFDPET